MSMTLLKINDKCCFSFKFRVNALHPLYIDRKCVNYIKSNKIHFNST